MIATSTLLPLIGAGQWVAGVALGVAAARRSRRYARAGSAPRLLARLAIVVFAVSALVLLASLPPFARAVDAWFPPDFTTRRWRAQSLAQASVLAWVLLALSAFWNTVLGVALRRRLATEELKRRTARVFDHRTPNRS